MENGNSVGDRIRECRVGRGLSVSKLAAIMGVSEGNIRHYETGRRKPKLETLEKFAIVLGVSKEYLTGETNYKTYQELLTARHGLTINRELYNNDVEPEIAARVLLRSYQNDLKQGELEKAVNEICANTHIDDWKHIGDFIEKIYPQIIDLRMKLDELIDEMSFGQMQILYAIVCKLIENTDSKGGGVPDGINKRTDN